MTIDMNQNQEEHMLSNNTPEQEQMIDINNNEDSKVQDYLESQEGQDIQKVEQLREGNSHIQETHVDTLEKLDSIHSAEAIDNTHPEEAQFQIVDEGGQLSLFAIDAITIDEIDKKEEVSDSCETTSNKSDKNINRGSGRKKPSVTKAPPTPALESVKLSEGWKIHYAATVFEVDILFEDELNNGIEHVTFEEIRLKLVTEEDAAELTPSGTKWRYDIDQKQLYPEAWGQDKGAN